MRYLNPVIFSLIEQIELDISFAKAIIGICVNVSKADRPKGSGNYK